VITTLKEIEQRLLAVMPIESTIDRPRHALAVASVVFAARRQKAGRRQAKIASTRAHSETTAELTRLLKQRMREHGRRGRPAGLRG
jgi:hypothetical protein